MAVKKRGLGKGLDALLGGASAGREAGTDTASVPTTDSDLRDIPIDLIRRGKYQPRRDMDQDALQELADSIKAQVVMQPIVVR